jgi:hypothetical protein
MRMLASLVQTAGLLLVPIPAAAAEKPPILLARQGSWEINYDEDSCHLLARFGTGKQETIVKLTRFAPGTAFDLTLIGPLFESPSFEVSTKIGFTPGFPAVRRDGASGSSRGAGKKVPLVIFSGMRLDGWAYKDGLEAPAISEDQETAVTAMDLSLRGKTYRLGTGSLGKPMQAMRTCLSDLIRHWGYNVAVQSALNRAPQPINNPADWLRSDDYPLASIVHGHNGLVQFRLDVDAAGSVGGCHVLYRTNPDTFADLTCKLLSRRAKFAPALDAQGAPVRSFYVGKVRWLAWRP